MNSVMPLMLRCIMLLCILQFSVAADEYNAVRCPPEHTFRIDQKRTIGIVCTLAISITCDLPTCWQSTDISNVTWQFTSFNTTDSPDREIILQPSDRHQLQITGETILLTIRNPSLSDAGRYRIIINGTQEAVTNLHAVPSVFVTPSNSTHVYAGVDHVEIECLQTTPLPNVSFSWLREGEMINASTDPQIEFTHNSHKSANAKLILGTVDYADRATYTCIASGQYGNDTATMLLRVRNPRCWLYPFTGCFGMVFLLAIILGIDEWHKRRSVVREDDDGKEVLGENVKAGRTREVKNFPEIVAVNVPPKGQPAFLSYKSLQDREVDS